MRWLSRIGININLDKRLSRIIRNTQYITKCNGIEGIIDTSTDLAQIDLRM